MKLTFFLLLLYFSALGQQDRIIAWTSYMELPLIRESTTITNDTTVAQLWSLETKPGYTYIIQEVPPSDSVKVEAESFFAQSGVIPGPLVGGIDKADWIRYQVNVKKRRSTLTYRYALSDATAGQVQFRTGSITGTVFATIDLPPTGSWTIYNSITVPIDFGSDTNVDIYLTFAGSPRPTGSGGNLDWYMFK